MRNHHEQLDKRMFDFSKFYDEMADWMPEGATIAEVGVADGASAIYLAEALLNRNKTFTFYFIDDLSYGRDMQLRTLLKNICSANLGHLVEVIPVSSVEGACRFPDLHFDFVFIDASHKFEWTKADIILWSQKVKVGGILAGHDYNKQEGLEVYNAVRTVVSRAVPVGNEKLNPLAVVRTEQQLNIWKILKQDWLRLTVA